jgi:hypothetical protein
MAEKLPQGEMWVADVEHAGQKYQMICSKSLRFQLARELEVHHVDLVGSTFQVRGATGDVAGGEGAKVYACSWVKAPARIERVAEEGEGEPERRL